MQSTSKKPRKVNASAPDRCNEANTRLELLWDLRECCWWSLSTEIVLGFPVCNFELLGQYLLQGRVRLINAVEQVI
jgi:hypothetical protein